jgi:hypothetical protein
MIKLKSSILIEIKFSNLSENLLYFYLNKKIYNFHIFLISKINF